MAEINLFGLVTLDDAAEGPMTLKVWPPHYLEPILEGFRWRHISENGYHVRMDGSRRRFNPPMAGRPSPKRKGKAVMREGICQNGNRWKK